MNSFIEYITVNYAWLLFAAIIILLAIIGYYADKTNFGQKKVEPKKDDKKSEEIENIVEEEKNKQEEIIEEEIKENENKPKIEEIKEQKVEDSQLENTQSTTDSLKEKFDIKDINIKSESGSQKTFEENYEKLDKELDELLPDKGVIFGDAGDLLNDIDGLSLDKTQKINISDIPDLDDLDLPEIKDLKTVDEDVWKF